MAQMPQLTVERYDDKEEALYLLDPATKQVYRLNKEGLEELDENAHHTLVYEPAKFPAWLICYPGAKVETSEGVMIMDGVRSDTGGNKERLVSLDDFEQIARFYRDIFRNQNIAIDSGGTGLVKTFEKGLNTYFEGTERDGLHRTSVSITRLRHGNQIEIARIRNWRKMR